MRKWITPALAGAILAAALFLLLARPQFGQSRAPSESATVARPTPLISEQEAITKAIEAVRQAGLQDEMGAGQARLMPLIDAVRQIAGDLRFERALQDAHIGQPGREAAKLIWFVELPTNNSAYPVLLIFVDAITGEVHEWPRLPIKPAVVPSTPVPPTYGLASPLPTLTPSNQALAPPAVGTRPTTIKLGGRDVPFPPDAEVESIIVSGTCNGPCPQTPVLKIRRGNSRIWISQPSGEIVHEEIAPGEEGAFDIMKEVLR